MNYMILATIFSLAIAITGCSARPGAPDEETAPAAEVRAVAVQSMTLRPAIELSGVLTSVPEKNAVLSSPIGGQVKSIGVHEGQAVRAGDTLVVLDTRIAESDLARAKASLREVTATLALLKHGPQPEEIEGARQEALGAAELARAQASKLTALQPLHDRAEISEVQFEQARSAAASAMAASEAAAQRLKLLASGTRAETLEEADARVAAAEADVAARQLDLSLSTIQSPLDGVVTELPVRLGMMVERPMPVACVTDLSSLYAQVRIPAQFRAQVRVGSEATLEVAASNRQALSGTVERMGVEADTQTGDVDAFILIPNEDGTLQPGLVCTINVFLPEVPEALVVPVSAVANRNGEAVITAVRDKRAYEIVVKTGVRTEDFVQLTEGVVLGDLVATEGGYALPDGCAVNLTLEVN